MQSVLEIVLFLIIMMGGAMVRWYESVNLHSANKLVVHYQILKGKIEYCFCHKQPEVT